MKADYKNWMPKGMVTGTGCGSGALTIACAKKNEMPHHRSLLFIPMIILLILSVIETQWLAVGIIGAAVAICFILLFAIGWIEVELKFGQEFFKGFLHG